MSAEVRAVARTGWWASCCTSTGTRVRAAAGELAASRSLHPLVQPRIAIPSRARTSWPG